MPFCLSVCRPFAGHARFEIFYILSANICSPSVKLHLALVETLPSWMFAFALYQHCLEGLGGGPGGGDGGSFLEVLRICFEVKLSCCDVLIVVPGITCILMGDCLR